MISAKFPQRMQSTPFVYTFVISHGPSVGEESLHYFFLLEEDVMMRTKLLTAKVHSTFSVLFVVVGSSLLNALRL